MPKHNKLVRDKILEIIEAAGKEAKWSILSDEEYIIELKMKLHEEVAEFEQEEDTEKAVEELADILEVVFALSNAYGADDKRLLDMMKIKAAARGGFEKKVFLEEVEDE
ncbi:nucleoside triphosphate pyrophosphohydrolase [Bacillus tianshenii]|nr:nucleoside triphosphate pyrophosphohydrolase [Bacillus tianshenii]